MKNSKQFLGGFILTLMTLALTPLSSFAQSKTIFATDVEIASDKVGVNVTDHKDPPPPPTLSEKEVEQNSLSFYPNPCKEQLTIEFNEAQPYREVAIFDLIGNMVFQTTITTQASTIDTQHLKPGIYLIRTSSTTQRFSKL